MESRTLLSAGFPNVNISRMTGNQAEGAIIVDKADSSQVFAVSNIDTGDGLLAATSSDGGVTWTRHTIANDTDNLPPACCDPSASFDSFGNLFLAYLGAQGGEAVVAMSTNAGRTFSLLGEWHGNVDQPTITSGPGGAWVTFARNGQIVVSGAADNGPGSVGTFQTPQVVRGSGGGNFGDIAVGPSGQVMVTYQKDGGRRSRVFVNVDPDGLGPARFGPPVLVTTSGVGDFDFIPAQPTRGIDAEAGLAFDRSGGPFTGRVYLVYTDEIPVGSANTDVFLRYSDNQGATWSDPVRVNDDTGLNSQLLPRVALDNTSGKVAVSWYDSRNDLGTGGAGDLDQRANDDAQYFGAIVTPTAAGLEVSPNQQISAGTSSASDANNNTDLGDYTGLDFFNGTLHPLWFDNSNSTGDNPNGKNKGVNAYTANIAASALPASTVLSLGGLADPGGAVATLEFPAGAASQFVNQGSSYKITVLYSDGSGVSLSSIGPSNLLVTGPGGFAAPAQLLRAHERRGGSVLAIYKVLNPAGNWTAANAGVYRINMQPSQVLDGRGLPAMPGVLGTFVVSAGHGAGSHGGGTGPRSAGHNCDCHPD